MNFDTLRKYCATLPGATMDIKWGADECHCVGRKMFAVFLVERAKGRSVSFECYPERFLELTDVPGIVPAPYLARALGAGDERKRSHRSAGARTGRAFACTGSGQAAAARA